MAGSLDFDALEAAGIANPRQRADLIKYLDGLGFTVEEMVEAERRGRLFGLAGDVLQWSGRPIYTLQTAAEQLGLSPDDVAHAWALLGLHHFVDAETKFAEVFDEVGPYARTSDSGSLKRFEVRGIDHPPKCASSRD